MTPQCGYQDGQRNYGKCRKSYPSSEIECKVCQYLMHGVKRMTVDERYQNEATNEAIQNNVNIVSDNIVIY